MSESKIKVMIIQSRICVGGPVNFLEILCKHMDSSKYEFIVLGGMLDYGELNYQHVLENVGTQVRIIKEMRRETFFLNDIKAIWQIYKIIKREKPVIVSTHTAKAGTLGRIAAFFAGTKVIIHTYHGHVFSGYFSKIKTNIFLFIERFLSIITTRLISISPSQKNELVHKYRIADEKKFRVIRLGCILEPFLKPSTSNLREKLGLDAHIKLLCFIGRLVPIKNVDMAIRVVSQLDVSYHLVIVGGGEEYERLLGLCQKLQVSDRIHFIGIIEEIAPVYKDVDLLILTSFNEGTPNAIIEAMASSVPVVATDVGGVQDLVIDAETGFLVNVDDDENMILKIEKLFKNLELRDSMVKTANKFVRETYDYKRLITDVETLYTECLSKK